MQVNGIQATQFYAANGTKKPNKTKPQETTFTARAGVPPILMANWKMNFPEVEAFFKGFVPATKKVLNKWSEKNGVKAPEVLVATPGFSLHAAQKANPKNSPVQLAAENFDIITQKGQIVRKAEGAYTGATSVNALKNNGIETTIIGHSERREMFKDTNAVVNIKVREALKAGVRPVICCGESEATNAAGKTEQFVEKQILSALKGVKKGEMKNVVIAYEPIWAIGTGKTCSAEDANKVISFIRSTVAKKYGQETAYNLRILYGGSASGKKAKELLEKPNIDGFLVGGASLKPDTFSEMVSEMSKAKI